MKDLTKYYIDLSKLSEKHKSRIVKILNTTENQILWHIDDAVDFLIHYRNRWCTTDEKGDLIGKTELTYPEFIKLLEGGEGERKVDIYNGELNTERILTYKKLSEQYNIEESTVRDIFNAGADWVNKLNSK
jgi:hypothetical protein